MIASFGMGAAGGFFGALAKELWRTDRELSWRLIPQTIAGLCAGTGGVALARAVGFGDWHEQFAAGFVVGMIGQAAMVDIARWWLRSRFGLSLSGEDAPAPPKPPGQGSAR